MDAKTITKGTAAGAVAFGAAAIVAPGRLQELYGLANNADTRSLMRPWGNRTLLLGAMGLAASDDDRQKLVLPLAVMSAADAAAYLYGAAFDGAPRRASLMAAATSATFAALLFYSRKLA